jgi:hypothetical protein
MPIYTKATKASPSNVGRHLCMRARRLFSLFGFIILVSGFSFDDTCTCVQGFAHNSYRTVKTVFKSLMKTIMFSCDRSDDFLIGRGKNEFGLEKCIMNFTSVSNYNYGSNLVGP